MKVLRWTARILSALILAFHALSFLGDRLPPNLPTHDVVNLILWGLVMLGLIIAWKWEGIGGVVIILVSVMQNVIDPVLLSMWAFWIAPFTGVLFLIYSVKRRRKAEPTPKTA